MVQGPTSRKPTFTKKSGGKQTFFGSSATSWSEFLFGTPKSRAQLGKDLLDYAGIRALSSPLSGGRNVIDTARAVGAMRSTRTGVSTVSKFGRTGKTSNAAVTSTAKKKAGSGSTAQYPNLPRTGRKTATGKPYTTAEVRKVTAASGGNYKVAGYAAAAGGLMAIGAATTRGGSTRQKYSGMKPGAEKVRTGPGGAYVGSGMGAKARPKTDGNYVGSTVGGNTGSRNPSSTPTPTARAAQRQRSGAVKSKPKIKRTALVKQRLRLAEERAARGDVAGAAAYANAALNIQKKGKGTAQSMRRVQRVATTYQQAASAGKKPIKRKKG